MTAASAAAAPAASGFRLPLAFSSPCASSAPAPAASPCSCSASRLASPPWRRSARSRPRSTQALARQGRLLIGGDLVLRADPPPGQRRRARGARCSRPGERIGELPRHGPRLRRQERAGRGQGRRRRLPALWRGRDHSSRTHAGAAVALPRRGAGRARAARSARLEVGSPLTIGEANVTIGGVLGEQPDRLADRLAYGPKLLMSRETLARTGLVQPGSLIRWTYRVKLPEQRATDKQALTGARAKASRANSRKAASPSAIGPIPRPRSAATPTASPNSSASSG